MATSSVLATILVLAGVRWMRAWVFDRAPMTEAAYRRPVLILQAVRDWRSMVVALAPLLPCLVAPRSVGWDALGPFEPVRWVAATLAVALAWSYATYERNAFLGRTHAPDRILLAVLAALVALHPVAIAPMIVQLGVVARQFEHPRCFVYSMTPIYLPLELLMALAMWPTATLLCSPPPALVTVLLLAVTGAHYFTAGLAKARIGPWPGWWAAHDRIHYLLAASIGQGWLGGPPRKGTLAVAGLMRALDRPAAVGTLSLELASIAMLTSRRLAIVLLLANVAMHVGILLASGLNFWKWVVADLVLAWLLAAMPESVSHEVFTPVHAALAAAVVVTQWLHLRCVRLGWLNTRWTSTFIVEAVGESGAVYPVPISRLAPYDMVFGQHRHYHLCPGAVVVSTYSVIGPGKDAERKWREIEAAAGDPEAMERVRGRFGRREHDEGLSLELDRFLAAMFDEFNRSPSRRGWWRMLAAPRHVLAGAGANAYRGQEPVVQIRIWHREGWYDGRSIRTLSKDLVREVVVRKQDSLPVPRPLTARPVGTAA